MATVIELYDSRSFSVGTGSPTGSRRFNVDLPAHQATQGDHVGGGPGQLPALGSAFTFGTTGLFASDYRVSSDSPISSTVEVEYSYRNGSLNPIDQTSLSYRPFSFSSTVGGLSVPYVRKVTIRPNRFEYVENPITITRPEVIVTLQVNIAIANGLPSEATLAAITAETGKIHSIAGQPYYLFLGGDGDVVNHDRFQVTYAWKGVPPFTPDTVPADYLPIPTLNPHHYYVVAPGTTIDAYGTPDARVSPPTIITATSFLPGDINNLPGVS